MTTTSASIASAKKRVRRAKRAAKRAMPLEINKANARKAARFGAIGASAWIVGKTLFSIVRIAVGSLLVVAAAAAAVSLVPKSTQRQLAGNVRDMALLAVDRAKSLAA